LGEEAGSEVALLHHNEDTEMPTLAILDGYRFFFWSLDLNEPPQVHVEGHGGKAKFWLTPVRLQSARGYDERQLN